MRGEGGREREAIVTGCSQEIGSCVVESIKTAIFISVKKKDRRTEETPETKNLW